MRAVLKLLTDGHASREGIQRCIEEWRTGTAFFVPSLLSIVIWTLMCLPSSRSSTTIGWLLVACIKDKARSCVLAWQKNPPTGCSLWAIGLSPRFAKLQARSSLLNQKLIPSLPKFGFGLSALYCCFALVPFLTSRGLNPYASFLQISLLPNCQPLLTLALPAKMSFFAL